MEKNKYPIGGYAPGPYMCTCCKCKIEFFGDKRAVQCEPCAIKMVDDIALANFKNNVQTEIHGIPKLKE